MATLLAAAAAAASDRKLSNISISAMITVSGYDYSFYSLFLDKPPLASLIYLFTHTRTHSEALIQQLQRTPVCDVSS